MTNHCGLFFTPDHIQHARKHRAREPFKAAWSLLLSQQQTSPLAEALWNGLRWRFDENADAGDAAAVALQNGVGFDLSADTGESLAMMVSLAQSFELARDRFSPEAASIWLNHFQERLNTLNAVNDEWPHYATLWLALLNLCAGVVLESDEWVERGAAVYRQTIEDEVRPQGFLPKAVDGNDGGSLWRDLVSVEALVLMAEAAAHIGLDLWGYQSRGISVVTAGAYLVYYYYYPDKWRWDTGMDASAAGLFREHGAFFEILNRRAHPRDIGLMLNELRPMYSLTGGLTTLSHGELTRKGLFG
jgi:hypothetical protein